MAKGHSLADWLGQQVNVIVDRKAGSAHPQFLSTRYTCNYGFIPGTLAGDGEAIDVYVIDMAEPVDCVCVNIVAVVERHNDAEDKLVGLVDLRHYTCVEIMRSISFCEGWFDTTIITMWADCASYTKIYQ